jgi:5-methylcytosine-specific restriction endonuclease McrA
MHLKMHEVDAKAKYLVGHVSGHHGDLTIDHYDGDKHNNNEDNLLVLCPNCHAKKTKLYGDNQVRYNNIVALPAHLWDVKI